MTRVRCSNPKCRRWVEKHPVTADDGSVYGPTCARREGLTPPRQTAAMWKPPGVPLATFRRPPPSNERQERRVLRPRPIDLPAVEVLDGQLPIFDIEGES